jgi:plastocyanin
MRASTLLAIAAAALAIPMTVVLPANAQVRSTFFMSPRPMVNPNVMMQNMTNTNMQVSSIFRPAFFVSPNSNNAFLVPNQFRSPRMNTYQMMRAYQYGAAYGGYGGLYGYGGMNGYGLGNYYAPYMATYGSSYADSGSYKSSYSDKKYLGSYGPPYDSAKSPTYAQPDAEPAVNVAIFDGSFEPKEITVPVGTTVRWTNLGQQKHEVVSDDGLRDSGRLSVQGSYTRKFNEPGTYSYHCELHPELSGKVIVR